MRTIRVHVREHARPEVLVFATSNDDDEITVVCPTGTTDEVVKIITDEAIKHALKRMPRGMES